MSESIIPTKPGPTVLIIDDDSMTRMLVSEALEPDGFVIAEAESGFEGIESFGKIRPDVILLDVSMPGMDGFECCKQLRKLPGGERVPIVMLTGNDDDESISQAFEAGATDFASKPMRWKLLGYRIRYLLRAKHTLEALALSQKSLAHSQKLAHVGNWEYRDTDSYWSAELFNILGFTLEQTDSSFESLLQCVPEDDRQILAHAFKKLLYEGVNYSLEHRVLRPDGTEHIVLHHAEATQEFGSTTLIRGTLQDITERKMNEARIEYLATHDALTGLPNRNLLNDRIGQYIAQARRTELLLAILVLDLDRFKLINDSYGHLIGDELLRVVSQRLVSAVREEDTVARLGGDEFVIALTGITDLASAEIIVKKIMDAFVDPFVLHQHELHVHTSVGVSIFPNDGITNDVLIKTADAALYSAKDKGRNGYKFYTRMLGEQVEERAEIEIALHQALARSEFELYYQPKVALKTGKVYGMEALLRWHRSEVGPHVGLFPPSRFIPVAEETGLIIPIGEWVLKTACAQLKEWHNAGHEKLTMAVNVSARQFRQQNIVELVRNILADVRLEAKYLELELTESVLVHNPEVVLKSMKELKGLGVTLSLDDFGTGYSSLSYLKQFPIDVVKIDQSFIRDVTESAEGASLARSIIAMADSLNMTTVAEGVETEGQLDFLTNNHCGAIQGYYFSHPLPKQEIATLLKNGDHLPPEKLR